MEEIKNCPECGGTGKEFVARCKKPICCSHCNGTGLKSAMAIKKIDIKKEVEERPLMCYGVSRTIIWFILEKLNEIITDVNLLKQGKNKK